MSFCSVGVTGSPLRLTTLERAEQTPLMFDWY